MTAIRQYLLLALFVLIIGIPAAVLSVLAVKGVDQQEAQMRANLEDTLLLELDQTNRRIQLTLDEMILGLHNSLGPFKEDVGKADRNARTALKNWQTAQPLAGLTFLLDTQDERIIYPELPAGTEDTITDNAVHLFYWRYLNFFSNREPIPVYSNIAETYTEEILESRKLDLAGAEEVKESANTESLGAVLQTAPLTASDEEYPWIETEPPPAAAADEGSQARMKSRAAADIFESDAVVQEQIFQQAREEGRQIRERNVTPQILEYSKTRTPEPAVRSVYIESAVYFKDLIQNKEYGLIPRIFDNSFMLLYWEKSGDLITGCELDMEIFRSRIATAAGVPGNSLRSLNILDHGGRPLINTATVDSEKWRRPFVAKEISELLPYWETAIILENPGLFEEQIASSRSLLILLISVLIFLIFMGVILLYRYSAARLKRVQQKAGFVTRVSHELKTPLTSIRMYSEMLSEGRTAGEEKQKKYLEYIASESQRLSRLIANVLDFAKLEKGNKILHIEIFDLVSAVSEFAESVKEEYGRQGFSILCNYTKTPMFVSADREAVMQVLLNLFSNAAKYSSEEKEIEVSVFRERSEVCCSVADKGPGIHPRHRKKIFREFYRVDQSITADTAGTGLGLSIARSLMRAQGGELRFTQRDPEDHTNGSVFTLIFPAAVQGVV